MFAFASGLLFLLSCQGSYSNELQGDPEQMQRDLAASNLRHFDGNLLRSALFPADPDKPISAETWTKVLQSEEGQEIARAAAMQAMLEEAPGFRRPMERGRGTWLYAMCDSISWLSWLVECSSDETIEREGNYDLDPPFVISLENFEWATCPQRE